MLASVDPPMCYTIASLRPSARATYPQEADDLLSIPIADAEGQHAAQISSSPKYHLRAQMVALTVAAIGIGISSWQIMPMYTSFGVLCSTGVALLFGLLTVAVSNGYVTATILRRVWAAIGIFGAFGSMLNAPFMDEADLVEYIRLEPERREAMHLGMLAVGSAHALFSFSLRMEVGITMWVIGCSILQNACFYFRTGDPSVPIRECLGATIPFSIGLAITELILRSSRRSRATPDKEPDFTPESACSEIQGITTSIAATPASNVGYARECDVSPGVEVEEFSEATEADSTRSSSPRHTVGVLCDLTLELLSVDLQINWSVLLGKGGASDVHLGEWLGTAVAVKVVRDKGLQLLRTEAKLLAQLRHPCICSVFGTMELGDGHRAIVLEYMSGGTAFELLHKKVADAPLPTEIACRIARETASGLAYLHTNSYMHRDVKSSNVLLDKNLHAKVADFGIAKHSALASGAISLDANPANPVEIGWNSAFSGSTHTFLMGTPRYMAPEVIGRPPSGGCVAIPGSYDHRCDVYSFGVLLWEVMHEAIPFGHLDSVEAARTAHSGARPPMSLHGQRAQFAPIIAACWSQAPDQRPALTEVARTLIQLESLGAGCDMQTAQQVFNGEALGGM